MVIPVQTLATLHPHVARLRRRVSRTLRPQVASRTVEVWYRDRLNGIVRQLDRAGADIVAEIRPQWQGAHDAAAPSYTAIIARARRRFEGIDHVSGQLGFEFARRSLGSVDLALASSIKGSLGVDVAGQLGNDHAIAEVLRKIARSNIELIKTVPEKYLGRVEKVLQDGWRDGLRWQSMVDNVKRAGRITEDRAWMIARDQTGKANAAFTAVRQVGLGIEEYIWTDCGIHTGPHAVRPTHQEMNGTRQRWNNPPLVGGARLHPGEDYLCRCTGRPVFNIDAVTAIEEREAA